MWVRRLVVKPRLRNHVQFDAMGVQENKRTPDRRRPRNLFTAVTVMKEGRKGRHMHTILYVAVVVAWLA